MTRISLCMIVRDEEANLPGCLATAANLVDELIIVDTGSRDRTREIAVQWGARVFDFAWNDDFAAARNAGLEQAAGDWIFWLDADDRIDERNRERFRTLLAKLPSANVAYLMTYLAVREMGEDRSSMAHHVKVFRNDPRIRWQYRVHEQIAPAVERAGGVVYPTDIVIHHLGYQDPAAVRRKLERNLRLLQLDHAERPDDPYVLFNLGRTMLRVDDVAGATPILQRSVHELPETASFLLRTAFALLVEALCRAPNYAAALATCRQGRARFPDDPELMLAEGLVLANLGDRAAAEACLLRLLEVDPTNQAAHYHLTRLRPSPFTFQFQA